MVRALLKVPGVERLVRTRYDNLAKVPRITLPRLILHGTRDELVPTAWARRCATRPRPRGLPAGNGAGHTTSLRWRPWRLRAIFAFSTGTAAS